MKMYKLISKYSNLIYYFKTNIITFKDNLIDNIGNSEFPWTVEAKIQSDNNVSIIMETETNVVNGYANFTKLGVDNVSDNIRFSFSFKLPEGLNA